MAKRKAGFVPAHPAKYPHERFHWFHRTFDVSKAWNEVIAVNRPVLRVAIAPLVGLKELVTVEDSEGPFDLNIPLIAVEMRLRTFMGFKPHVGNGDEIQKFIIDGWHRVEIASHDKRRKWLKVYVLNEKEAKRIML